MPLILCRYPIVTGFPIELFHFSHILPNIFPINSHPTGFLKGQIMEMVWHQRVRWARWLKVLLTTPGWDEKLSWKKCVYNEQSREATLQLQRKSSIYSIQHPRTKQGKRMVTERRKTGSQHQKWISLLKGHREGEVFVLGVGPINPSIDGRDTMLTVGYLATCNRMISDVTHPSSAPECVYWIYLIS